MERICVINNPNAQNDKERKQYQKYFEKLDEKDIEYQIYNTNNKEEAYFILKEKIDEYDTFAAIGGDGTIHTILQTIAERKDKTLAIIPSGRGNILASHHNIYGIKDSLKSIKNNKKEKIDIIKIEYTNVQGENKTVYCHCIFGLGYIEEVVRYSYNISKKTSPKLCYPIAATYATLKTTHFNAEYKVEKKWKKVDKVNTFIFLNQNRIGIFDFGENITDQDGELDFIIHHNRSSFGMLLNVIDVALKKNKLKKNKITGKTDRISIKIGEERELMVDGEIYEKIKSLKAEIMPKSLEIYSNKKQRTN